MTEDIKEFKKEADKVLREANLVIEQAKKDGEKLEEILVTLKELEKAILIKKAQQ